MVLWCPLVAALYRLDKKITPSVGPLSGSDHPVEVLDRGSVAFGESRALVMPADVTCIISADIDWPLAVCFATWPPRKRPSE